MGSQVSNRGEHLKKGSRWRNSRLYRNQFFPGQTMLEFVLVLPLLLFILLALLQFGVTIYAQSVVIGAAQEGARIAAQADNGIDDGIAVANRNITTGLGQVKTEVTGSADNEAVSIQVEATVPSFLPILNQSLKFNLKARANMIKEGWRS